MDIKFKNDGKNTTKNSNDGMFMDSITCAGLDVNDVLRVNPYFTLTFQIEIS